MSGKYCKDIIQSGNGEPFYSNSTQFPATSQLGPIKTVQLQERLQTKYTGGTVQHMYLSEAVPDKETIKHFLIKCFTDTKIPYISITPTFSICEDHGYLAGEVKICPHCNKETEVYTRVVGFYRPTSRFNLGKKAEWKQRTKFTLE